MNFKITTSKKVAEKVETYCKWEEKMKFNRSYKLEKVEHFEVDWAKNIIGNFSTLEFSATNGKSIKHEEVFFLGLFSATSQLKPADLESSIVK